MCVCVCVCVCVYKEHTTGFLTFFVWALFTDSAHMKL